MQFVAMAEVWNPVSTCPPFANQIQGADAFEGEVPRLSERSTIVSALKPCCARARITMLPWRIHGNGTGSRRFVIFLVCVPLPLQIGAASLYRRLSPLLLLGLYASLSPVAFSFLLHRISSARSLPHGCLFRFSFSFSLLLFDPLYPLATPPPAPHATLGSHTPASVDSVICSYMPQTGYTVRVYLFKLA